MFGIQSNDLAYFMRDEFVISSQNFNRNTMCLQCFNGWCGSFFWRIKESEIAMENHIALIIFRIS